jgi:hypothetical protein
MFFPETLRLFRKLSVFSEASPAETESLKQCFKRYVFSETIAEKYKWFCKRRKPVNTGTWQFWRFCLKRRKSVKQAGYQGVYR